MKLADLQEIIQNAALGEMLKTQLASWRMDNEEVGETLGRILALAAAARCPRCFSIGNSHRTAADCQHCKGSGMRPELQTIVDNELEF